MGLKDADPTLASIQSIVRSSLPLILPCPPRLVRIGSGFDSNSIGKDGNPWRPSTFEKGKDASNMATVELEGNQSAYRESFTFSSHQTSDHFSGSLGLSIGNDFLSGGVSASYDQSVAESKEGTQSSRHASFHMGRVVLNADRVSETMSRLQPRQISNWRETYGDYFVYGYVLGVERAVNLRINSGSRSEKESKSITVTVKLLWLEASHTESSTTESMTSEYDITVSGYDTLDNRFECLSSHDSGNSLRLQEVYRYFTGAVNYLEKSVEERMKKMNFVRGQHLSMIDCDRLNGDYRSSTNRPSKRPSSAKALNPSQLWQIDHLGNKSSFDNTNAQRTVSQGPGRMTGDTKKGEQPKSLPPLAGEVKKAEPPAPLIPLAGNYITFPTTADPVDQVAVGWVQNLSVQTATYYKLRCWFGVEDKSGVKPKFETYGESIVFIAAEYFDPKYKGPVTEGKHILSIENGRRDDWAMLKLDRRFEYGQDKEKDTTKRWIVYHPPIAKEPPRVIHQHRFGLNMIVNLTDTALKAGRASGDGRVWAISTLLKSFTDLVKAKVGDTLHQFEDNASKELEVQKALFGTMTNFNLPEQRRDIFAAQPISAGITQEDLNDYEALYEALTTELGAPRKKIVPKFMPIANAPGSKSLNRGSKPVLGSGVLTNPPTESEQPLKPTKPLEPLHQQHVASVNAKNRVANGYVEDKKFFKDPVQDGVKTN